MSHTFMMNSPNKALKMYNLNVNVATSLAPASILGLDGQCTTPEILNSLVAMSNPFDVLGKTGQENTSPRNDDSSSNAASSLGSPIMSPPSVQHTCSQLIKEGLKLTLQSKRKHSGSDSKDEFDDFPSKRSKSEELTVEDEERRKRRRERNKIAATKCRLKKREKTLNLVTESEVLETQNVDLKMQIKDLEKERRSLEAMLAQHECMKQRREPSAPTPVQASAPPPPLTAPFDPFSQPFIDPDFGDNSALISYNKDPNFGKFMDNFFPPKSNRAKSEATLRGGYQCEEEDPDVYRPNGAVDSSFFVGNDSAYSSFNTSLDHGCRA